jgi:hypothetical protein
MNANEINAVTHVTDVFVIGATRARARLTGIPKEPVTCVTRIVAVVIASLTIMGALVTIAPRLQTLAGTAPTATNQPGH